MPTEITNNESKFGLKLRVLNIELLGLEVNTENFRSRTLVLSLIAVFVLVGLLNAFSPTINELILDEKSTQLEQSP